MTSCPSILHAKDLFQLGKAQFSQGDYKRALKAYKNCIIIEKQHFSEENPELALSYNEIGLCLQELGKYKKSLTYFKKSKYIYELSHNAFISDLSSVYNNLGTNYLKKREHF